MPCGSLIRKLHKIIFPWTEQKYFCYFFIIHFSFPYLFQALFKSVLLRKSTGSISEPCFWPFPYFFLVLLLLSLFFGSFWSGTRIPLRFPPAVKVLLAGLFASQKADWFRYLWPHKRQEWERNMKNVGAALVDTHQKQQPRMHPDQAKPKALFLFARNLFSPWFVFYIALTSSVYDTG